MRLFCRKYFNVSKVSPFNFFDSLQQIGFSKSNPKSPLLQFLALWNFSKWLRLKISFSLWPSTLYLNFVVLRPAFFLCNVFLIRFYWNPTSFFTKNETHRGLLGVFGSMRLTRDFSSIFCRLRDLFSVEKNGFCCLQLKKKWFSRFMRIHSVVFLAL